MESKNHRSIWCQKDSGHGALAILLSRLKCRCIESAGGIGRGAIMALSGSNINVVGGVTGDCDTAVKSYLDGTLVPESEPTCGCIDSKRHY